MKKRVLVMGVGNYILSDEGIGVHAVKELEKMEWPENVEIYDAGTTGLLSIHKVLDADVMIAIDAIEYREEPGTMIIFDKTDIMMNKLPIKLSAHEIGFQEMLLQAELHDKSPDVVKLIGIVPESLATGIELSPCCQEVLPKVLEEAKKLIMKYA